MATFWASQKRPAWERYGLAALLVAIGGVCNYLMPAVYGEAHYYFFSVAILGTALFGGFCPGLVATALSALVSAYFFLAPFHSFRVDAPEAAERLALFVVQGALISGVGHVIRQSHTPEPVSAWRRYSLTVLVVAGATVFKLLVFPSVERHTPFAFFYSAVVAAAWLGGAGAGIGATILSAASAHYLFLRNGPYMTPGEPRLVMFALESTVLCLLTAAFRLRLLRSELYLAGVFRHCPSGIAIIDPDARILKANPAFERMLHADKTGLEGRPFLELVDPGSQERASTFLDRLLQQPACDTDEIGLMANTTVASANLRGAAIRDGHLHPPARMVMAEDITERRRAEESLRQAELRLERGQRVEAIGLFAGGIAHDFNNLLVIIFGRCDQLLNIDDLPTKARAYAQEILDTAQTAADLTRRLLSFARRQPQSDQTIDVNRCVMESAALLRRLLGARIELKTELAADGGLVRADPSQLQQVLLNLAANARDAMPSGGRLTIDTSSKGLESGEAGALRLRPGEYVILEVADTGCGMDESTLARIFEPLFSTKDLDKGSGLGLATVHSIVKKLGGAIRVESCPGEGSCFWIYLPRVEAKAWDCSQTEEVRGKAGNPTTST
ncbi:MAG TPA: ATP-binding protein [Bryobacteraceae bacterium]